MKRELFDVKINGQWFGPVTGTVEHLRCDRSTNPTENQKSKLWAFFLKWDGPDSSGTAKPREYRRSLNAENFNTPSFMPNEKVAA